jgi:flagellar hook-length control protein FliK
LIGNDLHIVSRSLLSSNQNTGAGQIPKFHHNETVPGKVLRSYGNGSALILIKGRHVHVRSHVSLTPGSTITLQVKSLSPMPVLKLLGEASIPRKTPNMPVLLNALKENIWKLTMDAILQTHPGQNKHAKLLELMKDMTYRVFQNPTSDLLKLLVSKAGFNLESKLKKALSENRISKSELDILLNNDLKGLLLKAITQNEEGSGYLKRLLAVIKNFQLFNQGSLEQGGKIFIPIPMQFPEGIVSIGQLLIEQVLYDENSAEKHVRNEEAYQATFFLNMSCLGPMRAEVLIRGNRVTGSLFVVERQTKEIIEDRIPVLVETLTSKGFVVNDVGCHIQDIETVTEPLLMGIIQEDGNSICLVA